jgi:hypothetical protein
MARQVVDLIPNGRHIAVTDANKMDYIRLISHHRLTSAIRAQIDNFLEVREGERERWRERRETERETESRE